MSKRAVQQKSYARRAAQVDHDRQGASGVAPEAVRVELLGGFRVSVGPRTIEESAWRLKKAAGLLKLLALAREHRIHGEQAMDRLWPDLGRRAAANNLYQALHATRRILEPDPDGASRYLARQDEQLVLCPDGWLWVDVEAFEEAVATARRAREPGAYRAAIELYAGELLPGDLYEEWAESRRQELREAFLSLLVELSGLYEVRGEYDQAVEVLRRAVEEEPTREEAQVGLVRLYAFSGRRGESLRQYERFEEVLSRELGAEPAATSRHLYEEILSGCFPPSYPPEKKEERPTEEPAREGQHNLPAARSSFVGRERELIELKRALTMTPLLTLTGVGGVGKTRLALEVARDLVGAYPDGVWVVELAGLSEEALVPQAVAEGLGVSEQPGHSLVWALVEALSKKRTLLVLDNCEHVIGAAAGLVDALLESCPHLRVLATSREALGVTGEVVRPSPSLSVPDPQKPLTVEDLEGYESARLFAQRALQRSSNFALTPENAKAVAEVCWRLEGIPLAIELAATRVSTLSVEQISKRLENSVKLLVGGGRTATPRQQTLRGAIDWSYDLLSGSERMLFERLSVFARGWTLEAAEAVGRGDAVEEEDVLDLLTGLLDKSLVVAEGGTQGAARYRMLEPIRQYAREQLEAGGEADAVRRRHSAFFLSLAAEAEPGLRGSAQQGALLKRLEVEGDNLRAALAWSLENEPETALRLATALARFWEIRSYFLEGRQWLEAVLYRDGRADTAVRAKALTEAGTCAWHQGDYEQAAAFHAQALELYQELGDEHGAAFALICLAAQDLERGDYERAAPAFEEALSLCQRLGDKLTAAYALGNLGEVERHRGKYVRGRDLLAESLSIFKELDDNMGTVLALSWLGMVAAYNSDHDTADEYLREGLSLAQELGNGECSAKCLEGFASLAGAKGQAVRAARLFGAAEAVRVAVGAPLAPVDRPDYERQLAAARAKLDAALWEAAWAEGRAMTPEQAAKYALSEEELAPSAATATERPSAGEPTPKLTRREKEIAALVGRGLTSRQVADQLIIAERTVDKHVANVLKKLGLSSRDQIAPFLKSG